MSSESSKLFARSSEALRRISSTGSVANHGYSNHKCRDSTHSLSPKCGSHSGISQLVILCWYTMTDKIRVAILDDYQRVAFTRADWSSIQDKIAVDVFDETLHDEGLLAQRLQPYSIICAMRERTKFTASLIDKLPNLKLIATTGMVNRGIDVAHAKKKGIFVSGTGGGGNSTLEHIWALLLATVRYVAHDDADVKARKPLWQSYIPLGLSGRTLGLVGAGNLGSATGKVRHSFFFGQ